MRLKDFVAYTFLFFSTGVFGIALEDMIHTVRIKRERHTLEERLSQLKDREGNSIFLFEEDRNAFIMCRGEFSYAENLSKIADSEGRTLLYGKSIVRMQANRVSLEDAQRLHSITDLDGRTAYKGYDIQNSAVLGDIGYDLEVAGILRRYRHQIRGAEIVRYKHLGVSPGHIEDCLKMKKDIFFEDTSKPDAIVVFPSSDHNGGFHSMHVKWLFGQVKEGFDTRVVVAEREHQVYALLDSYPGTRFLWLNGHGSKSSLSLGEEDPGRYSRRFDETYSIDIHDEEISHYLQKLDLFCDIFLASCDTGSEDQGGSQNLHSFISDRAPMRRVASPKKSISLSIVEFNIDTYRMRPVDISMKEIDMDVGRVSTKIIKE